MQEFLEILDKCSSDIFEVLHTSHAAAQAVVPPIQAPAAARPTPKAPTAELKPEKLAHDSTMANYCSWGKQFRAYFNAGRFSTLSCTQQQAFLNNCIYDVLHARVNREASATTPIYSNVPGFLTCSGILDSVFLESNPYSFASEAIF